MSPSVHKLLVHGPIARNFTLLQAFYAEDAGEHWHKQYRKFSQGHCRQTTREFRLTVLFKTALALSDPDWGLSWIKER